MAARKARLRSTLLLAGVVMAASGCGDVVADSFSKWQQMRAEIHERRLKNDADMRTQMAAGAFGRDQLLPGGNIRSAASFGKPPKFPFSQTVMRLPSLHDTPVANLELAPGAIEIRRGTGTGSGSGGPMRGDSGGPCTYKPVMTAEDLAACR